MAQATLTPSGEKLESFTLLSGHSIPAVGLGTWKSGSLASASVLIAIVEAGYRHRYRNGIWGPGRRQALQAAMQAGIETKDLFVTSKLWCNDLSPYRVRKAFNNTLQELQLDYLDLYLIPWPFHLKDGASRAPKAGDVLEWDIEGVWREMEKLVKENLLIDIGICNFSNKKLNKLLGFAQTMPSMEMHPGWRNDEMLEACKNNGIHVTAYSPLGSQSGGRDLIRDRTVETITNKVNKTAGQVLVKWALQRGTCVIPKSTHPERIRENILVSGWEIPHPDFQALSTLSPQRRVLEGEDLFVNKNDGTFRSVADR